MIEFNEDNQLEIEREFLALILNKPEILTITQIKPEYLKDERLSKLFEYVSECFSKYKTINPVKIGELHRDLDARLYVDLLTNVFYQPILWKEQLEIAENSIITNYKIKFIGILNSKLNNKKIDYETYMKKIKELDDIQIISKTNSLTAREISDNINEIKTRIVLNNFETLDKKLNLVHGDFLIVGAITGAGKSGFLINLMNDLMDRYQCIYFNMEMSKSTIYKRMISISADIPISCINNPTNYQQELIDNSIKRIENNKVIVEHKANNIKAIKNLLIKAKDITKHTVLFIDHLGLTRASDDKKTLYEQLTEVAQELRQLCLEYDCTIIGASQLNRSAYNSNEITLSMLKDSGEIENSASKVILLYKDKENSEFGMNVEIAKNRDGIMGIVRMNYNREKQIFKEL